MRCELVTRAAGWAALLGLVFATGALAQAQQFERRQTDGGDVIVQVDPQQRPGESKRRVVVRASEANAAFWLGLNCSVADEPLRTQLDLPQDQGLLVDEVVADSPAARAGFQRYDVLLRVDDRPLAEVQTLVDLVQRHGEKELEVRLIRAGKPLTLRVTPARRPDRVPLTARVLESTDREVIARWLAAPEEQGQFRMRLAHPGILLPAVRFGDLPKDTRVSITKSGSDPAKIVVERNGKSWEATENDLQQLPEDVRRHVSTMLVRGPWMDMLMPAEVPHHPWQAVPSPPRFDVRIPGKGDHVDRRLEELKQQLDALQRSVDEIRRAPRSRRSAADDSPPRGEPRRDEPRTDAEPSRR
jgi:hypothetical protein